MIVAVKFCSVINTLVWKVCGEGKGIQVGHLTFYYVFRCRQGKKDHS